MIPYFISSHPGCTDADMKDLAAEVKSIGIKPEQVQDFTPTPMTLSTLMYYTGFDPYTGKKVYVARNIEDKRNKRNIFSGIKRIKGIRAQRLNGTKAQGIGHRAQGRNDEMGIGRKSAVQLGG